MATTGSMELPPLSPAFATAFAIFGIFLIVPLSIGGSIALAANFGTLDTFLESPVDANGFAHKDGPQGKYHTWNQQSSHTYTNTQDKYGETYTALPRCTYNPIGDCHRWDGEDNYDDDGINIIIPDVFQGSDEIVAFYLDWYSSVTQTYCSDINAGIEFDYAITGVNGNVLLDGTYSEQYPYEEESPSVCRNRIELKHVMTVVEINNFIQNYGECTNCVYTLEIENWDAINPDQEYTQIIGVDSGYVRVESADMSGVSGTFVLTVVPWALSIVMLTVSLASTRYWNPVYGNLRGDRS